MAVWLSDVRRAANGPPSRAQIAERGLKVHLGHGISTTLPGWGAWFRRWPAMANGRSTPWPEHVGNQEPDPRAANSGNNIGGELIFDLDDAIA